MVRKEIWMHLLAYNLIRKLMARAALAAATHRVNDRPDRIEPRAVKRRPKKLVYLNEPRSVARTRLLNGT